MSDVIGEAEMRGHNATGERDRGTRQDEMEGHNEIGGGTMRWGGETRWGVWDETVGYEMRQDNGICSG